MNRLNEYLSRLMETSETILKEISTINLKQSNVKLFLESKFVKEYLRED